MPDPGLTLERLGWNSAREELFAPFRARGLTPGRVAVEDKHYFTVVTPSGALSGQVTGKLLHEALNMAAMPKVGDWVAYVPKPNEEKAAIHHVLDRTTKLSRKLPGRETEEQILATNIDVAFTV